MSCSTLKQWRIQDFSEGGAPTPNLGLFCNFFAENCMKIKEFGPPGGHASLVPPLDPPMLKLPMDCPFEDNNLRHVHTLRQCASVRQTPRQSLTLCQR